ncbi:MAG TPA: bifunctional methylenetetrahydrofolate dehydrogenase/methenyltetrahydrofolate cyclohydrolase FolD [Anaeromyxobacter sp.]
MIIDGKQIAAKVRAEVAQAVKSLGARGIHPGLTVVRVGDDPASAIYVRGKRKDCEEVGIRSVEHHLPATTAQAELMALIARLDADPEVHGILVQLPLPKGLDERAVLDAIDPRKDADGFHPFNVGALSIGIPGTPRPCTPAGVMRMLDEAGVDPKGKRALVVGRSNIVGKPMAAMLLERHATVTVAHSRTADLAAEVGRADILVAAIGKAELVKGAWVKEGAAVVDVGMNRLDDGRLVGDVEYAAAAKRAAAITPVPGGVGPMTRAMLLVNTVELARRAAR